MLKRQTPNPAIAIKRSLTDEEAAACREALEITQIASPSICEAAINAAQLLSLQPSVVSALRGPRALVATIALRQRASGITLGSHIYIHERHFGPGGSLPLALVVHEVAHVVQFIREGHATFLARYLRDYSLNLLRGMSDYEAYLNIPHEIEARQVEAQVNGKLWS